MPKPIEQKIEQMIAPSLTDLGYGIVRVKFFDGDSKTLQIMAERLSDGRLGIEDCEKISHHVSALLDVEDPLSDAYNLEVSSPGIDRPLVKLKDFTAYIGHEAKLSLQLPVNGRKRFKGELLKVTEQEDILLQLPDSKEPVTIAFSNIDSAKLVLTDKLLKSAKHNQ